LCCLGGDDRVCFADLLRLLRLHGHGARLGPHAGLQADDQLQDAVLIIQHFGVLEALAHLAVELAARLPVHPTRRQPRHHLTPMPLGGRGHGASWPFVVWGLAHGTLLVAHRYVRDAIESRQRLESLLKSSVGTVARVATTLVCVSFCWVLFRATTFQIALEM